MKCDDLFNALKDLDIGGGMQSVSYNLSQKKSVGKRVVAGGAFW